MLFCLWTCFRKEMVTSAPLGGSTVHSHVYTCAILQQIETHIKTMTTNKYFHFEIFHVSKETWYDNLYATAIVWQCDYTCDHRWLYLRTLLIISADILSRPEHEECFHCYRHIVDGHHRPLCRTTGIHHVDIFWKPNRQWKQHLKLENWRQVSKWYACNDFKTHSMSQDTTLTIV